MAELDLRLVGVLANQQVVVYVFANPIQIAGEKHRAMALNIFKPIQFFFSRYEHAGWLLPETIAQLGTPSKICL